MMEFCDKHNTKWDSNKNGDCPICYAASHVGGSATLDWRAVALMFGERICDTGPIGYYDLKAYQWLEWTDKQVQNRFRELHKERNEAQAKCQRQQEAIQIYEATCEKIIELGTADPADLRYMAVKALEKAKTT